MDVHIGGREAVNSWRDFAIRYLLIALGIASAWAVNQWSEARAHRRLAEQTRVALRSELEFDLHEVRAAITFTVDAVEQARPFRQRLVEALRLRLPPAEIERTLLDGWRAELRDIYPTLRRDAWEAAVAGQAVTHLSPDELRRYSAAYTTLRDSDKLGAGGLSAAMVDLRRRFSDWELNRRIGQFDGAELARVLLLWSVVEQGNVVQLRELEASLAGALGVAPLPVPGASAPSR